MYCLLELVSMAPNKLSSQFIDQLEWIKVCIRIRSQRFSSLNSQHSDYI